MAVSYYGLITVISNQMEEDGFFKRTGMEDILGNMSSAVENVKGQKKQPQDHKKKAQARKPKSAEKAAKPSPAE